MEELCNIVCNLHIKLFAMKKGLLSFLLLFVSVCSFGQLLSWTPNFAQESTTPFTITLDASKGNQGLFFYTPVSDVYVHIGVITNLSTGSGKQLHWETISGRLPSMAVSVLISALPIREKPYKKLLSCSGTAQVLK